MSQVTEPVLLDSTGQDIVEKLQDIVDAINGGTIDPLTVTANGTYTPPSGVLGYAPVTVNVQSGVPLLTRSQWDALTTAEKQAYNLVAIQDANSGYHRGELVNGADYRTIELLQSGTAKNAVTVNTTVTGHYKLFVLAINSEATSYALTIAASLNSTALTAETSEHNNYSGSGSNRRNYTMNVYDLQTTAGDTLEITLATNNNYSSFVFGIIDSYAWTFGKAMTTPDGITSGSNTASGMAVYGTFAGSSGGTINVVQYAANDTVTTASPGTNYKSSYIFWFE